jgi:hypothetical protein
MFMSDLHIKPPVELIMNASNIILFNLNPICIVDFLPCRANRLNTNIKQWKKRLLPNKAEAESENKNL